MFTEDEMKVLKNIANQIARGKPNREYYASTERILYARDKLKIKIESDILDIADLTRERVNKSSLHFIKTKEGPELDDDIRHKQKIRNRERALLRTQKMIERIEKSLKQIETDPYYEIIPRVYFDHKTIDEVAEQMQCSSRTVHRNRVRLINDLVILFYGADALDM